LTARNVIITTGGRSVRQTGWTVDGFKFAKNLDHTVSQLCPTEVPILSDELFIKSGELKGLRLKDIILSLLKNNGKPRILYEMNMLYADFGITGLAALRCSKFVLKELEKQKSETVNMEIDFFPEFTPGQLRHILDKHVNKQKDKTI